MTLSKTESVIFLYIEKRRLLLYEVSPLAVFFDLKKGAQIICTLRHKQVVLKPKWFGFLRTNELCTQAQENYFKTQMIWVSPHKSFVHPGTNKLFQNPDDLSFSAQIICAPRHKQVALKPKWFGFLRTNHLYTPAQTSCFKTQMIWVSPHKSFVHPSTNKLL